MGRAPSHKSRTYKGKKTPNIVCNQQYPDCPKTPNSNDCGSCPLWGTGYSYRFRYGDVSNAK